MAGMANRMKKRAIKATTVSCSKKVAKRIPRCDIVALNKSMENIMHQNRQARQVSEQALADVMVGCKQREEVYIMIITLTTTPEEVSERTKEIIHMDTIPSMRLKDDITGVSLSGGKRDYGYWLNRVLASAGKGDIEEQPIYQG